MCHKGKCFLTIPVERACLVLAIIKAVICAILLLASVVMAFARVPFEYVGPIGLASVVAFTFTVLLCNGICNRLSGQVKAYFIYGVVSIVIEAIVVLAGLFTMIWQWTIVALIGCVIHSLFVLLVHDTYNKLFDANPSPLVIV